MSNLLTTRREGQRKLTAATVLASLLLFFVQAFVIDGAAAAPVRACCRAHGRHSMQSDCNGQPSNSGAHSVQEKCPCCPLAPSTANTPCFTLTASQHVRELPTIGSVHRQRHASFISSSFDSSHPKRGPPTATVLL
jgi:hypothetical protein